MACIFVHVNIVTVSEVFVFVLYNMEYQKCKQKYSLEKL